MKIIFEKLDEKHRKDVMDIYSFYALNTTSAFPLRLDKDSIYDILLENGKRYPSYAVIDYECSKTIGFCRLRPYIDTDTFCTTATVTYFISREYVNNGIGGMCLKRLEEDAANMGINHLIADISSENDASINFHKKHGFECCGELSNIGFKLGRSFSIVIMQKELQQNPNDL